MSDQAVLSSDAFAESIVHVPAGIAIIESTDLTVRSVNPHFLKAIQCREADTVGRPLFEVMPEARQFEGAMVRNVIERKVPYSCNAVAVRLPRNGAQETAYFNLTCQPFQGDGGGEAIMIMAHEVTDLVTAKERAREKAESLRLMVSQSPIAMAVLRGREFVVEAANPAMLTCFGNRDPISVKNRKLFEIVPELLTQSFSNIFERVFKDGIEHIEREKAVYIEGSPCNYVDLICTPLPDDYGNVSGILMTIYDVSEKVSTRLKTEENEQRLRMVIDASGLGTWELNLKTKEFAYSDEYLATFGVKERLSHEELLAFMHPDDLVIRQQAFRQAFNTGWLHYVSRIIWKDQSVHWIEAHGKVIYDEDGNPFKMMGTSRDMTEEKLYQQGIQESEEKFRLLADSMPQFIWTSDVNGNLTYFNRSVFDYSGLSYEQLQGQGWIEIVHPEDRGANMRKWRETVRKGGHFLFEHRFRRYDGLYRWQLSRATPQYDSFGRIQMWVGTSTDIHDQKTFAKELEEKVFERTRELKETNETLERTNRELEQFAFIASHDLQEPLRKIMTFSDMLKKNIHDEISVQKYFSKIDSSARRMGDLIKSVLDYSRLPAHPGQLVMTNLNEVVEHVKSDLELTINEKSAVIQCGNLPAIPGVPLQIHQLFSNLIGNALKFCACEPCIIISARLVRGSQLNSVFKADDTKQYVELKFKDNGIGFDARFKDQIFTIFQRLHGWQQYSGTGIGLALCKKIVENHQGHISAESEPGKGSIFFIYLPAG